MFENCILNISLTDKNLTIIVNRHKRNPIDSSNTVISEWKPVFLDMIFVDEPESALVSYPKQNKRLKFLIAAFIINGLLTKSGYINKSK